MARRYEPRSMEVNLTPMIDLTFNLIIFFLLASQFGRSETEPVHVPRPTNSQAREMKYPSKLIITLVHDGTGGVRRYKVGPRLAEDFEQLRSIVQESHRLAEAEGKTLQVIVRADRDVHYRYVRPVLETLAQVGLENVNLAAEVTSRNLGGQSEGL